MLWRYTRSKSVATAAVSHPLRVQIRHGLDVLRDQMVPEILASKAEGERVADGEVPAMGSRDMA